MLRKCKFGAHHNNSSGKIQRAQPPHRKEIFPAVLTTQFLSILLSETKPTLPITGETSMDHS